MKKSILIICAALITLSLTAFSYMNWNNSEKAQGEISYSESETVAFANNLFNTLYKQADFDLFYNVESRFMTTITKEDLHKAKSIIDILPGQATDLVESYQVSEVVILHDDANVREKGKSDVLNTAQLKLLQSADYSTDFYISANCKRKDPITGGLKKDSIIYYMTIIPEKKAEYTRGFDALIEYLKESSQEATAIIRKDQLRPGKVNFTVTKEGAIAGVKLLSTSGYPSVDKELIELISDMPGKWEPATNSKGEKVDQELVFFFGLEGC